MGIYGRDYMRDPGGRPPVLSGLSVTTRLILLNVVLWFLYAGSLSFGSPHGGLYAFITDVLLLHPEDVFGRLRVWQPLTALFFHDATGLGHIFFNMLFLWVFGRPAEDLLGRRAFLRLYLLAGLASTLAFLPLRAFGALSPGAYGLGASGAIYGVGVFLALRRPQMPIYFFFVRMPLWVLVGVFLVGREFLALALLLHPAGSTVAHLTGAAFGLLYERLHARTGALPDLGLGARWRQRREAAQAERAARERHRSVDDQARVDELLEKIHREGIGALSRQEKDFLERASKRYPAR